MLPKDLQDILKGKHETGDLANYFKARDFELKAKVRALVNPEVGRHMRDARYHELKGTGPIPPEIQLTGFWVNQAWHIDIDQIPYKVHIVRWSTGLWELASGYEAALDMLDVLMDVLAYLPAIRSVVIRDVIGEVPDVTEAQRRELDEYARAAGM